MEENRQSWESGSGVAAMVTPAMDRYNGRILILKSFLIYFAAPVVYIGIVQAALCDRLGASATVANLPASTYLLGSLAPLVLSWVIPHRWTRTTLVTAYLVTMSAFLMVLATLILPVSNTVRLWAVGCGRAGPHPGGVGVGGPRLRLPMPEARHDPEGPGQSVEVGLRGVADGRGGGLPLGSVRAGRRHRGTLLSL
ncbi:MAG: hypothetical protein OXH11_19875 [Candidatus Aminicenantes bacterium]|nr:hypothetical protein [Candidatus Aminicenantes bacterium]